jgi:hypothetical protein
MGLYRGPGLGEILGAILGRFSALAGPFCVRSAMQFRQLLIPGVSPPKVLTKPCFREHFSEIIQVLI